MAMKPITEEQLEAVTRFAAEHGRGWKRALNEAWQRAAAGQVLQHLRNSHGPSWLEGFRLPT